MDHSGRWQQTVMHDGLFRAVKFMALTSETLSPASPLYGIVGRLHGLNLRVGPGDVTADCDPKHIDKRKPFHLLIHASGLKLLPSFNVMAFLYSIRLSIVTC